MFQMANLLLKGNNSAKLFWNPCISVPVMAPINSDGGTHVQWKRYARMQARTHNQLKLWQLCLAHRKAQQKWIIMQNVTSQAHKNNNSQIKGRRPSVPWRVKCQYVVNMSITCMLKKCHQRDGKFPPLPPLKAPPLIKYSMGFLKSLVHFKTHIINILSFL